MDPTLALALPAAQAEALARFLAGLPDDYVDDDQLVTAFSAERAVPVVATVPNLVEHADVVSLSIYADGGRRPVTVYDKNWKIPLAWWAAAGNPPMVAPERPDGGGLTVELRVSRCGLRLLSEDTDEPVEHPFTWDWRDRADLAGVRAAQIAAEWRAALTRAGLDAVTAARLRALRPALTLEVYAASFLLGADLSRLADASRAGEVEADRADLMPLLRRRAVRSWIEVGLAGRDRRSLTLPTSRPYPGR